MKRKRIILMLLILIFVAFNQSTIVYAILNQGTNTEEIEDLNKEIEQKKEKIKQIEKSIEQYKSKINQKKTEVVSLRNQAAILDNHITEIELDVKATNIKLETLDLEIQSLNLAIEDKEASMRRQKQLIAELVRNIHTKGDKGVIYVLAAYDDFSKFYNELQQLETIQRDLGKSAKSLRTSRDELEEKKNQKDERKKSYEDLKDQLDQRKIDLEEQTSVKQNLLIEAQSSELKYKSLVNSLTKQYQEIESEIFGIEKEVRLKLEKGNSLNEIIDDSNILSWPTQSRYITAKFHDPDYPYRNIFEHNAVDIRASQGTPVKAAASGYVGRARTCKSWTCYSYIMLIHANGLSTVYGHLSGISVSEGQFITRGTVIGKTGGQPYTVGAGPFVTGPHIHFETRKNGIPVNPLNYLVKDY